MPSLETVGFESAEHDASSIARRGGREAAERLVTLAEWLSPPDRALVEAVYADGKSVAELARLMGRDARALRRRLRRLVERMSAPEFAYVGLVRDTWSATMRRVATACVLEGRSLRDAAQQLGLSLHVVRRQRERVRILFAASETSGHVTGAGIDGGSHGGTRRSTHGGTEWTRAAG